MEKGLSRQEARRRLEEQGENRLSQKRRKSAWAMFFAQFKDIMIIILAVATLLSVLMGEITEAVTIIAIVLLNALMGFIQEYRTEKTLASLKALSAPVAKVVRDGVQITIPAAQVVVGDRVRLEAGDKVPADLRADTAVALSADESILTGESVPVSKGEGDQLFMGTIVASGRGEGRVYAVGMHTEMGGIAKLLDESEEEQTPLQKKLGELGIFVAVACVVVCLLVAGLGYLKGESLMNMILTGVSLAVAAVPEGMPAIVTIVLALSVGRILKKGAVIRKLHAVETLGCAGVICTDKTGTVTQNKMTVKTICTGRQSLEVTGDGYGAFGSLLREGRPVTAQDSPDLRRLLLCGALCATSSIQREGDHYEVQGDPTEIAVLIAAAKGGILRKEALERYRVQEEAPFDSRRKLMSVVVCGPEGAESFCKGAPDILLERCTHIAVGGSVRPLTRQDAAFLEQEAARMARSALRVIALACGTGSRPERDLTFLGLMGMIDPPRAEVAPAVRECRRAGIKPVMITGDHRDTAVAIAAQVGIWRRGDEVLTGRQVDALSEEELARRCMGVSVFARVSPANKLKIVRAYKAAGQVVAMTGDGVNDAPAVKEADIGVAMGISGTDVTKEASAVVVLDDNFATIISAVEEGRVIYQNIRRFIRYLLTSNLGEVLSMLFSMLLGMPTALLPIQILMMNLLTDGLPAIALGMEPPDADIMSHRPRPKQEGLFAGGLLWTIVWRGFLLGAFTTFAYSRVLAMGAGLEVARSAGFLTMILAQMLHIFECRGHGSRLFGNPYLLAAVGASCLLACACVYLPLFQGIMCTAPVLGAYLVPVITAVLATPAVGALERLLTPLAEKR